MEKKVKSVNIAPSWVGILPALLALLESKNGDARRTAQEELRRMAAVADMAAGKVARRGC